MHVGLDLPIWRWTGSPFRRANLSCGRSVGGVMEFSLEHLFEAPSFMF